MEKSKDSIFRTLTDAREGMTAIKGAILVSNEKDGFEIAVPSGPDSIRLRYKEWPGRRRPTVMLV